MFGANPKPKKIVQRKVQVTVKKAPAGASDRSGRDSSQDAPRARGPPAHRYKLTTNPKRTIEPVPEGQRKSLRVGRVQKRKAVEPSVPAWGDSSSSDELESDRDSDRLGAGLRKRRKTSSSVEPLASHRCLGPDLKRRIRVTNEDTRDETPSLEPGAVTKNKLVHGREMVVGEWAKEFVPAFQGSEKIPLVHLQYPSATGPETFELVQPRDETNFQPLADIYLSIEETLQHYLPPEVAAERMSESDGTVRRLKRAVMKNKPEDFKAVLDDYNDFTKARLRDGTIDKVLDSTHAIPLSLVRRILDQVYSRTVSPHAHLLRRVKDRETTYGELLPQFVHFIFQQTGLNSSSVFVDLGSGVGNVVLQAALQTGAESWGIEIMPKPAEFALAQASELRARARKWNISLGTMHLLQGSFLDSPEIDRVLERADVILVNNKVFDNRTNADLLLKFLSLKAGCKVVSLVSFGGSGGGRHSIRNEQDIGALFDHERYESGTNSVSWAGDSVEYFIATKARG